MAFSLLLWAMAAAARPPADPHVVPDTSWNIDLADGWSEEALEAIEALPTRLPASFRFPAMSLTLTLEDAPDLGDGRGHLLGHLRGRRRIVLYVRGLVDRLSEHRAAPRDLELDALNRAETLLVQRTLVHELAHLVDRRENLSRKREWRDLSGWQWWSPAVTPYTPTSSATGNFASPWGAMSAAEDFATFAEVYFVPPTLGPFDADQAPRCRYPTKFAHFEVNLDPHPKLGANVVCSKPADGGFDPAQIGEIEVWFPTPSTAEPATIAGHLLIAMRVRDDEDWRWDTIAMLADNGGASSSSLTTIMLGLVGGYPSVISRYPAETTRFRYVEGSNRDLLRYRVVLDEDEKLRFLTRLDDMVQHWRRPYLFFQQNCTALVIELANAVEDKPMPWPFLAVPDRVLSELVRRGRLEPVSADPVTDLAPATRARLLSPAVRKASRMTCGSSYSPNASPRATERTYRKVLELAEAKENQECWTDAARLLILRSSMDAVIAAPEQALPTRDALLRAVRDRLSPDVRIEIHEIVAARVAERWARFQPRGRAAQHTPYRPLQLGFGVAMASDGPVPLIHFERAIIDMTRGAPFAFPPAAGLSLSVLESSLDVGVAPLSGRAEVGLLDVTMQPRRLMRRFGPVLGARLLSNRASVLSRAIVADWLSVRAGAGWTSGGGGHSFVTLTLGLVPRSEWWDVGRGTTFGTWGAAPLRLEAATHTDGRLAFGLYVSSAIVPAVGTGGSALWAEARGTGWVYLGEVGMTAVKLAVEARGEQSLHGYYQSLEPIVSVGFQFERR